MKLITEPPSFWWSLGGKLLVTLFPQELTEIILCICTNRESLPDCENQVFLEIWVIQLWILGFQSDLYVWWLVFRNSIGNSYPIFGKECWIVGRCMQATKFTYRVSTKILAICIIMNLANATAFNRTLFKAKIDQVSLCPNNREISNHTCCPL